jgi:hypothetical protein
MPTAKEITESMNRFKEMSLKDLTNYVLAHRDDREAWIEYASRPRPNAIRIPADLSPEEEEKIFTELLNKAK